MKTSAAEALATSVADGRSGTKSPKFHTISVVVTAHTEDRWPDIVRAVASALAQTPPPLDVVLVVDHNPGLALRARRELTDVTTVENDGSRGASGARNTGVENSLGDIVVFLDDDQAAMQPNWLQSLCRHLSDPQVIGVGGGIVPDWPGDRPHWFPGEFDWVVGGSYVGMPETVAPIRNVWGGNTAIHRSVFHAVGGFRAGFGKVGQVSRPEDTDLCLRAREAFPFGEWLYDPQAEVSHRVPPERITRKYFVKRCWHEGRGKAALVRFVGNRGLASEGRYMAEVLPRAVLRELRTAIFQGETAGFARCAAIFVGLLVTTAGWLAETVIGVVHGSR